MEINSLIPEKQLKIYSKKKCFLMGSFFKGFALNKFVNALDDVVEDFKNLGEDPFEEDLDALKNNEIFIINAHEIEALSYKIEILNKEKTENELLKLNFFKYYFIYKIIDMHFCRINTGFRNRYVILKMQLNYMKELESKIKIICQFKGLSIYKDLVAKTEKKINLLKEYEQYIGF